MPGWHGSTRHNRLPRDWYRRRTIVRRRAGGQCEAIDTTTGIRCPLPGTDCDHIQRGDNHSLDNLAWLCTQHHKTKTAAEATAARTRRNRTPEPHPGIR